MAIDRRRFLALAGAMTLVPRIAGAEDREPLFVAARRRDGSHEVAVIGADGLDRRVVSVDARGHSFAIDRSRGLAVAFERAPGRHAVAFDIAGRKEPVPIRAAEGRHFFGHGIFTPDGHLMLATENDYDTGRGVTGVYDVTDGFRRIGEFACEGIGPHDILRMPDGRTACIANGGILTHPDYDKVKLNLDTMAPSLVYLDIASGEVVESVDLGRDLRRLSIRHLALDRTGSVWFGCQYEGDATDRPALVGRHRRGAAPELFAGSETVLNGLDNYVGSVAIDMSGEIVATSSPRGGIVAFWDAATGRSLGIAPLPDGCGVAPLGPGMILATSGRGAIRRIRPGEEVEIMPANDHLAWDNHVRRI